MLLLPGSGACAEPVPAAPAAEAESPHFDVFEYVVDGNTVLATTAIHGNAGAQQTSAVARDPRQAIRTALAPQSIAVIGASDETG